jgi:hypothetical protein
MSNNTNTNTGNNNSVLGSWALYSAANDTSCNSAFGTNSLLNHTTGSFNTSLGAGSMTFNITGNRNVAVGSSALEFNTNSENNTAIGTQALFGQRDGSNNTAIGINAGLNDVSGSFNTYLGANTGTSTSLNTYTNSTAIGYGAIISSSNRIVLGTSGQEVYIPGNLNLIGTSNISGGGSLTLNPETIDYLVGEFDILTNPVVVEYPKFNISLFSEFDFKITQRGLDTARLDNDIPDDITEAELKQLLVNGLYLFGMIDNFDTNNKSGYDVNNGVCNVAIGPKSLSNISNITTPGWFQAGLGSFNTALGSFSQMSNTKGKYNTSIGSHSLLKSKEGSFNVGVGFLAGTNDISGNNNTYLGAGTETIIPTQGFIRNSTAIGYQSKIDASYQIVLGTTAEFVCIPSNRGLSIGKKTAPASNYALDVVGSINFSGEIYQNGTPFVSGSGSGGGTSNSITGDFFVSGDISGNGNLDITGDISGNGDLFVRGSVEAASYNATSDYRIKDNVRNLDEEDTISNLRPVKYLNKQTNKQDFGLIAHELQSEYPDLVSGEKDGQELQSVNYIGLISVLIKEVQELKRITAAQAIEISTFRKG